MTEEIKNITGIPQPPIVLTIAGSDPSGGAGIQADLKTFAAWNVFGTSAITAIAVQNTKGVTRSFHFPPDLVYEQCKILAEDLKIDAIKIGMLANKEIVEAVSDALDLFPNVPIVLDPVMTATSGDILLEEDAISSLVELVIPKSSIITPNLFEASLLLDFPIEDNEQDCRDHAIFIQKKYNRPVLLKGGHGRGNIIVDFFFDGNDLIEMAYDRIDSQNTHGTGCTYSAALAAALAWKLDTTDAVSQAKAYVNQAIINGANWSFGQGSGPVSHNLFPSPLPYKRQK